MRHRRKNNKNNANKMKLVVFALVSLLMIVFGFEVVEAAAPTQGTPLLNSTFGTNFTNENLTVYNISTFDGDGDNVTNIINWLRNGASITMLNVPFEGGSNNTFTKDYAQNNSGFVNGSTWNATGGHDGKDAYVFDGVNDTISFNGTNNYIPDKWTIAMWINRRSGSSDGRLFCKANSTDSTWYAQISGANTFEIRTTNSTGTVFGVTSSTPTITLNTWYHVAATYDGEYLRVYVNGMERPISSGTNFFGRNQFKDNFTMYLGKLTFLGVDYYQFNGTIDDFMILSRALSPGQINALYNNRTDLLSDQETRGNEKWSACITPNDGYQDGITSCSANLTVNAIGVTNVLLNSTGGLNTIFENLTINYNLVNGSDRAAINWNRSGVSIALVNYPFEGGSNSTFTKDYSQHPRSRATDTVFADWNSTGGHDEKGAYMFNGIDDSILARFNGYVQSFNTSGSWSIWIKPARTLNAALNNRTYIAGQYEAEPALYVNNTGHLIFEIVGSSGSDYYVAKSSATTWNANQWYHIIGTWNKTHQSLYVNGVLQETVASTAIYSNRAGTNFVYLGRRNSMAGFMYFNGTLDDFMFYNITLKADQARALNNSRYDLMTSSQLTRGDTWRATVTPNDGYEDGAAQASNSIALIANLTCGDTITTSVTLGEDLYANGTCITAGADSLTINCNGYKIIGNGTGTTSYGITATGKNNTRIENCTIMKFYNGISIYQSNYTFVKNNWLNNNTNYGIYLQTNSYSNTIINNTALNNTFGISIYGGYNSIVLNNTAYLNYRGIIIEGSTMNTTVTGNTARNNSYAGITLSSVYNVTAINNTIYGSGTMGIHITGGSENTVANNTIYSNPNGMYIQSTTRNIISNNSIYLNQYGMQLISATNNNISGNNIYDGITQGIYIVTSSTNNKIINNIITNHTVGIGIYSDNNSAEGNILTGLNPGISLNAEYNNATRNQIRNITAGGYGISLTTSKNSNNIIENNITLSIAGTIGIYITTGSNHTLIKGNAISGPNNVYGLLIYATNTTARDNTLSNLLVPILIQDTNYSKIINNTIRNSNDSTTYGAIYLRTTCGNNISGNNIYNSTDKGIYVFLDSNYNIIEKNIIDNAPTGIYIQRVNNNTIQGNRVSNSSSQNIFNYQSDNTTIRDNTVSGSAYGIYLYTNSSYLTVINNTVFNNTYGILMLNQYVKNNTIANNTVYQNTRGISIYTGSANSSYTGNILYNNSEYGIYILSAVENIISNNTIFNHPQTGIFMQGAQRNTLQYNQIFNNTNGIYSITSANATITYNTIYGNTVGINLSTFSSQDNNLTYNDIYNNTDYNVFQFQTPDINLTSIYWGTKTCSIIDSLIYDKYDNGIVGTIYYEPFLNDSYPYGSPVNCTTDNNPPTQGIPLLNSTDGKNQSYENLTVYNQTTYDFEGNSVKNIISWKKNNSQIALVQLPFEGGSTDTFTKDYSGNDHNATVHGALWQSGGGYDGKGAYQTYVHSQGINVTGLGYLPNYTIMIWVNPASVTNFRNLLYWPTTSTYFAINDSICVYRGTGAWNCTTKVLTVGEWAHLALSSQGKIYINGEYNGTIAVEPVNGTLLIADRDATTLDYTGYIDEFVMFNYTLSAEQIRATYNNKTNTIVSQEILRGDIWQACITPNDGVQDGSTNCSNNITVLNTPPIVARILLNSTFGTNYTNENLTCYVNATDTDLDNVSYNGFWYKNGIEQYDFNLNMQNSGQQVLANTLNYSMTSKNEIWSCKIRSYDGTDYSQYVQSDNLTIRNTPPSAPLINTNLTKIINKLRTTSISWNATADIDNDSLTFFIYINGTQDFNTTSTSSLFPINITLTQGATYEWWAQAFDGEAYSDNSTRDSFVVNSAPNVTTIILNSTFGTNYTNENLTCYVNATDSELDNLNYSGFFLKNGMEQYSNLTALFGSSSADNGNGVIEDSSENVYITGTVNSGVVLVKYNSTLGQIWNVSGVYTGTGRDVVLDSQENVIALAEVSSDIVLAKYDKNKNLLWNITYGTPATDITWRAAVDGNDNLMSVGYNLTDIWIFKFDSNGTAVWNKTYGSAASDTGRGITTDSQNNVIVGGSVDTNNITTLKYDSNGILTWVRHVKGSGTVGCFGIASDSDDNIATLGETNSNLFVIKYDSNGNHLWNKTFGTAQADYGRDISFDSEGNVLVAAFTQITAASNFTYWLTKLNKSNGALLWNTTFGANGNYYARGMYVNKKDTVFMIGEYSIAANDIYTVKLFGEKLNNQNQNNLVSFSTANNALTNKNEIWQCKIKSYDDLSYSSYSLSSELIIRNSLPIITNFTINATSSLNKSSDNITIYYQYTDLDFDAIQRNETNWYDNSILATEFVNYTILYASNTTKGQIWYAALRIFDGNDFSNWTYSNNITITNAPPTQGTPILNSSPGMNVIDENLTAHNISTADDDNDAVKNIFDWRVNNQSIALVNVEFKGTTNNTFAKDYSSFSNNLTGTNTVYIPSEDDNEGGMHFDEGASASMISNKTLTLEKNTTILIRYMFNSSAGDNDVMTVTSGSNYLFDHTGTAIWTELCSGGQIIGAPNSVTGTWFEVALVRNTDYGCRIYSNGALTGTAAGSTSTITGKLYLGRRGSDPPNFNGTISFIRIYNRSLSAEQIKAIYENKTNVIRSDELKTTEQWKACITPYDGTENGEEKCSNEYRITGIELTSPTDNEVLSINQQTENFTFFYKLSLDGIINNCSLIINNTIVKTNIAITNNATNNITANYTTGQYPWQINCSGDTKNLSSAVYTVLLNHKPTHTAPLLNSTYGTNFPHENLTVYNQSTQDSFGNPIINIIDWRKNNNSLAVFNIEFKGATTSNQAKDYSSYSNDLMTYYTEYNRSEDNNRGALKLLANGYMISERTISMSENMTIHTKFKLYKSNSDNDIVTITSATNYLFDYVGSTVYSQLCTGGTISAPALAANQWYDFTLVKNKTNCVLYYNGNQYSTTTAAIFNPTGYLYIGRRGTDSPSVNGTIAFVKIYNYSLTAEKINMIYRNITDTTLSGEIKKNEVWQACITPYDGYGDGDEKCSNNATINTPMINAFSPASGSIIDRDVVAADADNLNLTASANTRQEGINISFYTNLTNPTISGQSNIYLGSQLTNSTGYAMISWNARNQTGDKVYAGNWTWWGQETTGTTFETNSTKNIYVFGGLNLSWRYIAQSPGQNYFQGEIVNLEAQLYSLGPETGPQLNVTYNAKVNTTLLDSNGTTHRVALTAQ